MTRVCASTRRQVQQGRGRGAEPANINVPNVSVTCLTLVCSRAPGPLELDLTSDHRPSRSSSLC